MRSVLAFILITVPAGVLRAQSTNARGWSVNCCDLAKPEER
jgi:hypothetical protein